MINRLRLTSVAVLSVSLVAMGFFPSVLATGWPVFDFSTWWQMYNNFQQLKKQYRTLNRTYQNSKQQLEQVKQIASYGKGHYGYGSLLNGAGDLSNREWSPESWDNALQGIAGNNPERYKELVDAYNKTHPSIPKSEYQKGTNTTQATTYQNNLNANRAASVQATYVFNDIKKHLDNLYQLGKQIDQTKNTKAATDLTNRIQLELGFISIEELKMQAVLNEQLVQQGVNAIGDQTSAAQFNEIPDK